MDVFGVVVLAIVTAVSGGIMRDVLIGVVPPVSIADWHPVGLAVAVGGLCFLWPRLIERLNAVARCRGPGRVCRDRRPSGVGPWPHPADGGDTRSTRRFWLRESVGLKSADDPVGRRRLPRLIGTTSRRRAPGSTARW